VQPRTKPQAPAEDAYGITNNTASLHFPFKEPLKSVNVAKVIRRQKMDDVTFEFGMKETLVGHVETDSGGVIIADGLWGDEFPSVSQDRVNLNFNLGKCKIPVYAFMKNGRRYLLVALDDNEPMPPIEGTVEVTDLPSKDGDNDQSSGDSRSSK